MSRGFYLNAETMVYVRGRFDSGLGVRTELGLTEGPVRIRLKSSHVDVHCDDYGPHVPADVLWMLSEAEITMSLVHFDYDVLAQCYHESMGASQVSLIPGGPPIVDTDEGFMEGAGWPIGAGRQWSNTSAMIAEGNVRLANSYITLVIASPINLPNRRPWRFFSTYLAREPFEIPLGTGRSLVRLVWRAIPYTAPDEFGDVPSADAALFDHDDGIEGFLTPDEVTERAVDSELAGP